MASETAAAAAAAAADSAPAAAPASAAPAQLEEDKWVVNKPAELRSEVLNDELQDCLGCFWSWVTCGGPAARLRQLYVNGRLSRCWDEYTRFKNCLVCKLNPDQEIQLLPGPHPLWRIRTRKQAAAFWSEQYRHLGAGATDVPEAALRPDLTSNPGNT